jgi:hypothetical protein
MLSHQIGKHGFMLLIWAFVFAAPKYLITFTGQFYDRGLGIQVCFHRDSDINENSFGVVKLIPDLGTQVNGLLVISVGQGPDRYLVLRLFGPIGEHGD